MKFVHMLARLTIFIGVMLPGMLCAEEMQLTVVEAVRMAVEKNLDLQIERYTPAQQEAEHRKSKGIYNPALSLQAQYNDISSYSASFEQNNAQLDATLSQLLPSGGTISLGFENSFADQAGTASYWQSTLGLSLVQPLLKNFGRETTELLITSARLGKEASLEALQAMVNSTVALVRDEYFKLYSLREELEVRKTSLDVARRVLKDTQARVAVGTLPAMEILNAEFGVAGREKELIDAERALHDQQDLFAQLLQLPPGTVIVGIDEPSRNRYDVSEQEEIKRAFLLRPELKELRVNRDLLELQARVAANRTRPDLQLSGTVATSGLGDGYSRDMDRLSSGKYPIWGVGLGLTYPLGNHAAENDYRKSRLKVDQIALQIRNQEELIANAVRSAVRAIETNYKQLEVTDRGRRFAEERLRAWSRKVDVGLATTKELLDVENDLAVAKNNQIKAHVAYANAVTLLWKTTGQLLEQQLIQLNIAASDALYRETR